MFARGDVAIIPRLEQLPPETLEVYVVLKQCYVVNVNLRKMIANCSIINLSDIC